MTNKLNTEVYGILDNDVFGLRIVMGIVTGVEYTEDAPIYTIAFGKNKWRTSIVTSNKEHLLDLALLTPVLSRVRKVNNLKIKWDN